MHHDARRSSASASDAVREVARRPCDVPPESSTTSASASAALERARAAPPRRRATMPSAHRLAPAARARRRRGSSRWSRRSAPGRIGCAGRDDLVAGREDRDARPPDDRHLVDAPIAARTPVSREVSTSPRAQHQLAPRHVGPGEGDAAPGVTGRRTEQLASPSTCGVLDHHDGVGARAASMPPVAIDVAVPGPTTPAGTTPVRDLLAAWRGASAALPRSRRTSRRRGARSRRRSSGRTPGTSTGARDVLGEHPAERASSGTGSSRAGRGPSAARKRRSASSRSRTSRN